MNAYVVMVLAGVGTYLARSSFILAVGERALSERVERALRNIGPAVLAALTASLLTSDGLAGYLTDVPEVVATVVGVAVAWWRRSFMSAFVAAVVVLWLLRWLV
jgi:branched-subunit amino acid transport protein